MRTPSHGTIVAAVSLLVGAGAWSHQTSATPAAGRPADGPLAGTARVSPEPPFRGRTEGQLTIVQPFAPGSYDDCNASFSGDPSAPGPSVSLIDDATGRFLHLGQIELHAVSCVDPFSPISSGQGVITAASGDQLFITFTNVAEPDASDPAVLLVTGTQWVNGGTGRFQDAVGTQACAFRVVLTSASTGTIEGTCEGDLAY